MKAAPFTFKRTIFKMLPPSILTKSQTKKFEREFINEDGVQCKMIVTIRYDDECNNGHNSFAITGSLFDREQRIPHEAYTVLSTGKKRWLGSCGCLHEDIAKYFPELAKYIKWHLCSSDGPLHYIANSLYWAGIIEGSCIELAPNFENFKNSAIWPELTIEEFDLYCTVDAMSIPAVKQVLKDRLPALMIEFKAAVEELGFVY
jgi:hypothetical protein